MLASIQKASSNSPLAVLDIAFGIPIASLDTGVVLPLESCKPMQRVGAGMAAKISQAFALLFAPNGPSRHRGMRAFRLFVPPALRSGA